MINLPTLYVLWKEYHGIQNSCHEDRVFLHTFQEHMMVTALVTELFTYAYLKGYTEEVLKEYMKYVESLSNAQYKEEWLNLYRLHGVI